MKRNVACWILVLAGVVLSSCTSQRPISDARPRFHEAETADAVVHYTGWEQIRMLRPEYRQDGFLVYLSPPELGVAFDRLGVKRNLAVVVLNRGRGQDDLNQVVADWRTILRSHGFKRIVCLEAGRTRKVDGLLILDDTRQSGSGHIRTAGL